MAYTTFGGLKEKVEKELDTEDEDFIQPTELVGYFNTAISIVEAEIVKLGLREKYLETEDYMTITSGTKDYDLPTDIVDNKFTKMIYVDGPTVYNLSPLKGIDADEYEDVLNVSNVGFPSHYRIIKIGEDHQLRLIPTPTQTVTAASPTAGPNGLHRRYFKDLNRYDDDDTNCDVPEICYEFILSYVRYRVYRKESHTNTQSEKEDMGSMLELMRETLVGQVADPAMDVIDQDVDIYKEMS